MYQEIIDEYLKIISEINNIEKQLYQIISKKVGSEAFKTL